MFLHRTIRNPHILDNLYAEQTKLEEDTPLTSGCLTACKSSQTVDKLTRDLLTELIDCIKIHENGGIRFGFADLFSK